MNDASIRKVTEDDKDKLLLWANDLTARENAIHQQQISNNEHNKWFAKKISDPLCHMYIMEVAGSPVGQVRIDIRNEIGEVDYSIAPLYRGNGYGKEIIRLVEIAERGKLKRLHAEVKINNVASQKVFLANEWIQSRDRCDLIAFEKLI